jgi:hypothetical protein
MDGRNFLDVAQELVAGIAEAHWRTAAGRIYYALLLECSSALERWGFTIPPRDNLHTFVRLRFIYSTDPDLKNIGRTLENLALLRNNADYHLASSGSFQSARASDHALRNARAALTLLDQIEADTTRRAAAIASIRP